MWFVYLFFEFGGKNLLIVFLDVVVDGWFDELFDGLLLLLWFVW